MITIVLPTIFFVRSSSKETHYNFIRKEIGKPDEFAIRKEDESDLESRDVLLLTYNSMKLESFEFLDILRDFAIENNLYVDIFDHELKMSKGLWYDEGVAWVEHKNIEFPKYLKIR